VGVSGSEHGRTRPRDEYADLGDLLAKVAQGDRDAFTTVYEQVADSVYGLAVRVLRDTAQAEDVAQETLINVWRDAARYDPSRGSAIAWIMTLTHRRAVDRVRSEQAHQRRNTLMRNTRGRPYDHVAELIEQRSQLEHLRRHLGALTYLQIQAIHLAYYEGHTYQEVAHLLDVPLGTIKSRIHEALTHLRASLATDDSSG
jgi:RNA polymerase sigma-70 factor (ECF subfamily)